MFQILDEKNTCPLLYVDGKLTKETKTPLTETWSYASFLGTQPIEYAQLYCNGKTLNEVCPEHLRPQWEQIYSRLKAFYRATNQAKLDLNIHCFYDMVPRNFLIEFCEIKNKISRYVLDTHDKPANYDFLADLQRVTTDISQRKLSLNFNNLRDLAHQPLIRKLMKNDRYHRQYIKYNPFGTKTGRLSSRRSSFPILTMNKSLRKIVEPNNDWFVEFDYNAMELRVMLGLCGTPQPQEDIHEWNIKNLFEDIETREAAKKKMFAWLYNPTAQDSQLSKIYNRNQILKEHWTGQQVETIYNRIIEADRHHALNYIIQSTAADLFLRQMIKLWEKLEGKDSYVAFCLHDSVVLDFSEKDMRNLVELKKMFADTQFGDFLVNVSAGKNFGEMKKIKI